LKLDVNDQRIRSPVTGVIARKFAEPGEYIQSGQNLMLVYSPDQLWIEANIKETAFASVKVGQRVRITVDALSGEAFNGRVERIGTAATSEFALLPSPNPSGNFTKTTQRVPVRILFDEADERLRPGLMVEVGIHVND
jgi:membrane fusion protein (multidrug efflux system)